MMMMMIAIGFLAIVVLMLATAFYREHVGQDDAPYTNPMTVAKRNARAYSQAARAFRKAGKANMARGLTLHGLVKVKRAHERLCEVSETFGATLNAVQNAKRCSETEPQFVAVKRAHSVAVSLGIRLRPTSQAMRKAYMRVVNRIGIDHATAKMIDSLLMS